MKSSPLLVCLIAVLGLSCTEKKQETGKKEIETPEPAQEATNSIVSLHQLLEQKEKFKDRPVTIAAFFVTHFEGPWICAKNGNANLRLETYLTLKDSHFTKIRLNKESRERIRAKFFSDQGIDWGELLKLSKRNTQKKELSDEEIGSLVLQAFPDGVPALITGTFRIGDFEYPGSGLKLENHPYIEVQAIQVVEADDPRWSRIVLGNPQLPVKPKKVEVKDQEGD